MAKIRGIKPEIWTDEDFIELSAFARLLFIGMWNYACDNGHLQNKPKQIKMRILPGDQANCAELIREIEARGMIERDGDWITIPNLTRHQKTDRRYFTGCDKPGCEVPAETVSQRESRRAHAGRTTGTRRANDVHTACALGDGDGDGDGDGERPRKRASRLTQEFRPSGVDLAWAAERYPTVDTALETEKFVNHWTSKSGKDATKLDWSKTWRNWIIRASEYSASRPNLKSIPRAGRSGVDEAWGF
jgi:hypothetical protein